MKTNTYTNNMTHTCIQLYHYVCVCCACAGILLSFFIAVEVLCVYALFNIHTADSGCNKIKRRKKSKRNSNKHKHKKPEITIAIVVHSPPLNEGNVFMLMLSTYTPCTYTCATTITTTTITTSG